MHEGPKDDGHEGSDALDEQVGIACREARAEEEALREKLGPECFGGSDYPDASGATYPPGAMPEVGLTEAPETRTGPPKRMVPRRPQKSGIAMAVKEAEVSRDAKPLVLGPGKPMRLMSREAHMADLQRAEAAVALTAPKEPTTWPWRPPTPRSFPMRLMSKEQHAQAVAQGDLGPQDARGLVREGPQSSWRCRLPRKAILTKGITCSAWAEWAVPVEEGEGTEPTRYADACDACAREAYGPLPGETGFSLAPRPRTQEEPIPEEARVLGVTGPYEAQQAEKEAARLAAREKSAAPASAPRPMPAPPDPWPPAPEEAYASRATLEEAMAILVQRARAQVMAWWRASWPSPPPSVPKGAAFAFEGRPGQPTRVQWLAMAGQVHADRMTAGLPLYGAATLTEEDYAKLNGLNGSLEGIRMVLPPLADLIEDEVRRELDRVRSIRGWPLLHEPPKGPLPRPSAPEPGPAPTAEGLGASLMIGALVRRLGGSVAILAKELEGGQGELTVRVLGDRSVLIEAQPTPKAPTP